EPDAPTLAYVERLHDAILATCAAAFERLEPAAVRTGLSRLEAAVNRRQRDPDGMVRTIGWNPDGLVDLSVPVLQSARGEGGGMATVVGSGVHRVPTGAGSAGSSPDSPGWLRESIRALTGGECVFLQGAAGNVMPLPAFDDSLAEPARLGRRLA